MESVDTDDGAAGFGVCQKHIDEMETSEMSFSDDVRARPSLVSC